MQETWAERDLDAYLAAYSIGSDKSESRMRMCLLCGKKFDLDEGVELPIYRNSHIRINGRMPIHFQICNACYWGAEKIESEDDE